MASKTGSDQIVAIVSYDVSSRKWYLNQICNHGDLFVYRKDVNPYPHNPSLIARGAHLSQVLYSANHGSYMWKWPPLIGMKWHGTNGLPLLSIKCHKACSKIEILFIVWRNPINPWVIWKQSCERNQKRSPSQKVFRNSNARIWSKLRSR